MSACQAQPALLALDFDGVVWDSMPECYQLALRAWRAIPESEPKCTYEAFAALRYLVQHGAEFGVLLLMLQQQSCWPDAAQARQAFRQLARDHQQWCEHFGTTLYRLRRQAREEQPQWWHTIQGPYPGCLDTLTHLRDQGYTTVICTTKDEESTHSLLRWAGYDLPVFGRSLGIDKAEHFAAMQRVYGVKPEQIVFVDDLTNNLASAAKLGITACLAGWGYGNPEMTHLAQQQGWQVLENLSQVMGVLRETADRQLAS